jgi:AcrR family transcriptional regulator
MASTDTRRRILDAALACFIENGYEQATIARIRERSGTSNGALFHHFASKEAIADALYVEAIASFQQGLWELLRRKPRSPRAMVRETIAHQLRWIEQHPDLARFVYRRGSLGWDSTIGSVFGDRAAAFPAAFRDITVAQLLSHHAGLAPNVDWRKAAASAASPREQRLNALNTASATALLSTPGSTYAYSNLGYVIAGAILERVTGTP